MRQIMNYAAALFIVAALFSARLMSQTSNDVPRIISYQGQIITNGLAMNGTHTITATLYSDPHGKNSVWQGSYDAVVTNGIFNITLGSGKTPLPDVALINRSLWIGISVDNGEEMQPRTQLSSSPYALNVPDKSITEAKLSDDLVKAMMAAKGHTVTPQSTSWDINGNTLGVDSWIGSIDPYAVEIHVDDAGASATSGRVMRYDGTNITGGYKLNSITGNYSVIGGGGYASNPNTIGTYGTSHYSFLGGGALNEVTASGGFLGGGIGNTLIGYTGVIVGGNSNTIGVTSPTPSTGNYSFIGGGGLNIIQTEYSSVVGGGTNVISNLYAAADFSAILGGSNNTIYGTYSSILGGKNLVLGAKSLGFLASTGSVVDVSVVSDNVAYLGNVDLWLDNTSSSSRKLKFFEPSSTGIGNFTSFEAQSQSADISYLLPNAQGAAGSFLTNNGSGTLSWTDGGSWNVIGNTGTAPPTNFLGTIDANDFEIHIFNTDGTPNQGDKRVLGIYRNATSANIIGGYQENSVSGGVGNIIAGGGFHNSINKISSSLDGTNINTFAFIGGGDGNLIFEDLDNDNPTQFGNVIVGGRHNIINDADASFIGAGENNTMDFNAEHCVIVGGKGNSLKGMFSVVAGGETNTIENGSANHNFIGGGGNNRITLKESNTITGGQFNRIDGKFSFIGGGGDASTPGLANIITKDFASVVGGHSNKANADKSFIGGGDANNTQGQLSVIVGGSSNVAQGDNSTISGGSSNNTSALGKNACIPGGQGLIAQSFVQTVIGNFNIPLGSSLETDFNNQPMLLPRGNDPIFIIGNGKSVSKQNAYEVSNNGHSIVFDNLGGIATISTVPAISGARYKDNTPVAWGRIDGTTGNLVDGFGVDPDVTHTLKVAGGKYQIVLNQVDPHSGAQITLPHGSSIVATIETTEGSYVCDMINATILNTVSFDFGVTTHSRFYVRICKNVLDTSATPNVLNCSADEQPFTFVVYARP